MRLWRSLFARPVGKVDELEGVKQLQAGYRQLDDAALTLAHQMAHTLPEVVALTTIVASRSLGVNMFDEQLQGALAMAQGRIVEMQTGEGKTLAAVPAIVWHARAKQGLHVLTANDYLAGRDADWMRDIYTRLGLSVAAIRKDLTEDQRRRAYQADITYATASEVGFDYLRDSLAFRPEEQVHRLFTAAIIDEVDSILIDEARVPLVIAGGRDDAIDVADRADRTVRQLVPGRHFGVEHGARQVSLTAAGVTCVERALGCRNLFDPEQLPAHAAVQDALHAHVLLRRDVDYLVDHDRVVPIDEFKGRGVTDRRWPAGLQTALETKERVRRRAQGRVLASVTIEHLIGLYPFLAGMTGTAATQAAEFNDVYGLDVQIIPSHRPIARVDHPDALFTNRSEKEAAVLSEIRRIHTMGRPVLVGTSSVEESERLSRSLPDIPHEVLNARYEAEEAAIVSRAGQVHAVTISTNMAGRGVDIRLGEGVADLGGLHVIGTNRHESRRIDHQLRGRAGRQGDPGSSRFFVSREDPLMIKYADDDAHFDPDHLQRVAEGQNLDIRLFLRKYETVLEGQRRAVQEQRQAVLCGARCAPDLERRVTLATIDELWADYLSAVTSIRGDTIWTSLGGRDPMRQYLLEIDGMFRELQRSIADEVAARLTAPGAVETTPMARGTTWTYLTTDEPFGSMSTRIMRGLVRTLKRR